MRCQCVWCVHEIQGDVQWLWWPDCLRKLKLFIIFSNKPVLVFSTEQIAIINNHYKRF